MCHYLMAMAAVRISLRIYTSSVRCAIGNTKRKCIFRRHYFYNYIYLCLCSAGGKHWQTFKYVSKFVCTLQP